MCIPKNLRVYLLQQQQEQQEQQQQFKQQHTFWETLNSREICISENRRKFFSK